MGSQPPLWVMGRQTESARGEATCQGHLVRLCHNQGAAHVLAQVPGQVSPGTVGVFVVVVVVCLFLKLRTGPGTSSTLRALERRRWGPPLPPGLGCGSLARSGRLQRAGKGADTAGACAGQGPLGTPQPVTTTGECDNNNGFLRDFLSWAAPAWLRDSSPGCPGGGADAGMCLPATRQGARRLEGKGASEQMDHWAALPLSSLALEHAAWES